VKVMIRRSAGVLSAYVPNRDLEAIVVDQEHSSLWGGWIRLKNGWILDLPQMDAETSLPITVNARKRSEES